VPVANAGVAVLAHRIPGRGNNGQRAVPTWPGSGWSRPAHPSPGGGHPAGRWGSARAGRPVGTSRPNCTAKPLTDPSWAAAAGWPRPGSGASDGRLRPICAGPRCPHRGHWTTGCSSGPSGTRPVAVPAAGDLARGQPSIFRTTLLLPGRPGHRRDEEDYSVVSVIDVATRTSSTATVRRVPAAPRITPRTPMTRSAAGGALPHRGLENCRILLYRPPAHRPSDHRDPGICGTTPRPILQPNGRSRTDGRYLVTEINGDWPPSGPAGARLLVYPPAGSPTPPIPRGLPGPVPDRRLLHGGQAVEFDSRGTFSGGSAASTTVPGAPLPNETSWSMTTTTTGSFVIDPPPTGSCGSTGTPGCRAPHGYLNHPTGWM